MRTVYVVTTAPGARVRAVVFLIVARFVVVLAWLGHILVLVVGAVEALIAARLGVPRLAYVARRLAWVARETWEEDL